MKSKSAYNNYAATSAAVLGSVLKSCIAIVVACGFFSAQASAQGAASGAAASQDTELEAIVVTGSRIRQVEAEGPTPVTVVTRDDIDKAGYQSVTDILDGLAQNTGGTFN